MLYALLASLAVIGFGAIIVLGLAAAGYLDISVEYGVDKDAER